MYADDTVLYVSNKDPAEIERCLNQDMENVLSYFRDNELIINMKEGKTELMLFGTSKRLHAAGGIQVCYNQQKINFTTTYKYLGTIMDSQLNLNENFEKSYKKASSRLRLLERMRCYLTTKAAHLVYIMMIVPTITLSCTLKIYNETQRAKLKSLDARAKKIINMKTVIPTIENFADRERCLLVRKCITNQMSEEFNNYFTVFEHKIRTRNNELSIKLPKVKLEIAKKSFFFAGGQLYNKLPIEIRKMKNFSQFKTMVRSHFT